MTNEFDSESARIIIEDSENINVSEPNVLKDLIQILINLALFVIIVYFSIFIISGIVINSLSIEKQIALEKFISLTSKSVPVKEITPLEQKRIDTIKEKILKADKNYPKTSNLNVYIMDDKFYNAFCFPNGNIYITEPLFKELKTDEELTFILAHEMAHYRHKDHLKGLRRDISNATVLILLSIASNDKKIGETTKASLEVSELKLSRADEEKADKYAVKVLNALYGNSKAGVKVMEMLKLKANDNIEFLSTHPNFDRRIKYIKKLSY